MNVWRTAVVLAAAILAVTSCQVTGLDEDDGFLWTDDTWLGRYGSTVDEGKGVGDVTKHDSEGPVEELTSIPMELAVYRLADEGDTTADPQGRIFAGGDPEDRIYMDVSYEKPESYTTEAFITTNPEQSAGTRYKGTRDTRVQSLFSPTVYVRTFVDVWRDETTDIVSGIITITRSSTEDLDNPPLDERYSRREYTFTGLVRDPDPTE